MHVYKSTDWHMEDHTTYVHVYGACTYVTAISSKISHTKRFHWSFPCLDKARQCLKMKQLKLLHKEAVLDQPQYKFLIKHPRIVVLQIKVNPISGVDIWGGRLKRLRAQFMLTPLPLKKHTILICCVGLSSWGGSGEENLLAGRGWDWRLLALSVASRGVGSAGAALLHLKQCSTNGCQCASIIWLRRLINRRELLYYAHIRVQDKISSSYHKRWCIHFSDSLLY